MSVSWLVLCPLARGLFRRAVSQSGSAYSPTFLLTLDQAAKYMRKKLQALGTLACVISGTAAFLAFVPLPVMYIVVGNELV